MFRPLVAAVAAALVCACDRPDDPPALKPGAERSAPARIAAPRVAAPAPLPAAPPAPARPRQPQPPQAQWPPAVMLDPDLRVRRFALEQWARNPTESLDLVTAAMVDEDESMRERAHGLFEQALRQRR